MGYTLDLGLSLVVVALGWVWVLWIGEELGRGRRWDNWKEDGGDRERWEEMGGDGMEEVIVRGIHVLSKI